MHFFNIPFNAKLTEETDRIYFHYRNWNSMIIRLDKSFKKADVVLAKIVDSASKATQQFKYHIESRNLNKIYFSHSRLFNNQRTLGSSILFKGNRFYYHIFSELLKPDPESENVKKIISEWPRNVLIKCDI